MTVHVIFKFSSGWQDGQSDTLEKSRSRLFETFRYHERDFANVSDRLSCTVDVSTIITIHERS
jgi:hypothetical protein